jgi:hypothetical protein
VHPDLDAVAAYGFQHHWKFEVVDDATLMVPIRLSQSEVICVARLQPETFEFRSRFPFRVAESKRMLIADFASRVNCHSAVAQLYLDHTQGEIGIATALPVDVGWLCPAMIDRIVHINLAAAERWLSGAAAVCYSDVSPHAAIELCGAPYPVALAIGEAAKQLESFGGGNQSDQE